MGYYIEGPTFNKADYLVKKYEGERTGPVHPSLLPANTAIICVLHNRNFEAAAFCFDDDEFDEFYNDGTDRVKEWVLIPYDLAKKLTGFEDV